MIFQIVYLKNFQTMQNKFLISRKRWGSPIFAFTSLPLMKRWKLLFLIFTLLFGFYAISKLSVAVPFWFCNRSQAHTTTADSYSQIVPRMKRFLTGEKLNKNQTEWKVSVFGVIQVRNFPHWNWIWRDMKYLSVFNPNAGKYWPE